MSTIYIMILTVLMYAVVIACIASFTIMLLEKLGIRDRIVERAPMLISKLFDCDFCLSFWVSLILAVILAIINCEFTIFIIVPFISTPITRMLL